VGNPAGLKGAGCAPGQVQRRRRPKKKAAVVQRLQDRKLRRFHNWQPPPGAYGGGGGLNDGPVKLVMFAQEARRASCRGNFLTQALGRSRHGGGGARYGVGGVNERRLGELSERREGGGWKALKILKSPGARGGNCQVP